MTNEYTKHQFAGVDRFAAYDAPRSYVAYTGDAANESFKDVLDELDARFGIERAPTGFIRGGEWTDTADYIALVNPARDGPEALWHIATDSYTDSGPVDMWGPLVAVARERGHEDAFGTVRTYRRGGEQRMDVFFGDITGSDPTTGDARFILGFETGADYFAQTSLYGQVIAWDRENRTIMRGLSKRYTTPHRGDAPDRLADWFRGMVGRIEKVGDTLYEVVAEAREYKVDLGVYPFDVEGWYESIGLPGGVSKHAGHMVTGRRPSAWKIYEAAASALTHQYEAKHGGQAFRGHVTTTNNILFAPESTERTALETARKSLAGQGSLDPSEESAMDRMDTALESLDESVGTFRSARDRMRAMIESIEVDEDEEVAA